MAQALPLTKLGSLFIKTLAKPLSKRIKHEFSRYEFTKQILIGIGQTSHSATSRMQIWSAGYRVRSIKPLEPEKALKDGAKFVGESFVFLVSGALVVWEYNRSAESNRKKDEKRRAEAKAERAALQAKLVALDARLKALEANVEHNSHSILGLGGSNYVAPDATKLVAIEEKEELNEAAPTSDTIRSKTSSTPTQEPSESSQPWWNIGGLFK